VNTQITFGQDVKNQKIAIPDSINQVFQTSCMQCHGSEGRPMSLAKLNFSKWNDYDEATGGDKVSRICTSISERSMLPKFIRETKPELIPSEGQIELICKWADSIRQKGTGNSSGS
jgi:hypothetical protein